MAEHNISMVDIEHSTSKADYTSEEVYSAGRSTTTELFINDILKQYFFVEPVSFRNSRTRTSTLKFFGDKVNVEIAKYTYKVLDLYFRMLADAYEIAARDRRTFYCGIANGYKERLKSERATLNQNQNNRNALIVVGKDLTEAFHKMYPNLSTKSASPLSGNRDAYNVGYSEGKNLNIHKGIAGVERPKLN